MKSIIVLLLISGAASAEELRLSRLEPRPASIKAEVAHEAEAPRSRFPKVWHPIESPAKPKPRSEAVWAEDGYLFRYSF